MAKYGSAQVGFLLIDGFDILGETTQIQESHEALTEETDGLGKQYVEATATGLKKMELTQQGFFNDAQNSTNDAFVAKNGVVRVGALGLEGNANAKQFIGFEGPLQSKYSRLVSREGLHKANASYAGSGAVDDGVITHLHQSEAGATGDTKATSSDLNTQVDTIVAAIATSSVANPTTITTVQDHGFVTGDKVLISGHAGSTPAINNEYAITVTGARTFTVPVNVTIAGNGGIARRVATNSGGAGYLQMSALVLGGYTNFVPKIIHSADNITFADLVTFDPVTTAPSAQRKVVAGTVNRYLATSWGYGGAGAGQSAKFMAGFARF